MATVITNYMSVPEAASFLGCTVNRVRQLITEGKVKAEKLHGRAWLISRRDIEKYGENPPSTGRPRGPSDS